MDIIKKCRVTLEFDVWEPLDKHVQLELDRVIRFARGEMHHAGNVRISTAEVISEKKL